MEAAKCPNKASVEWKTLVSQLGEDLAWTTWLAYGEDYPKTVSIRELQIAIGAKAQMSGRQIARVATRLKEYNAANGTSHSFTPTRVGQADLYMAAFRLNYLPVGSELKRQSGGVKLGEYVDFKSPHVFGVMDNPGTDYWMGDEALKEQENREVFFLRRLESAPAETQKQFAKDLKAYKYSSNIPIDVQMNVTSFLTGVVLSALKDNLRNKQTIQIYEHSSRDVAKLKASMPDASQEELDEAISKLPRYIFVRNFLQQRGVELNQLVKVGKASTEEQEEYKLIGHIMGDDKGQVFRLFEEAILRNLNARGYKMTKDGEKILFTTKEDGLADAENGESPDDQEDNVTEEVSFFDVKGDETGKTDVLKDSLTIATKQTMSTTLRTFLSAIPSERVAPISLVGGAAAYTTQFVNEDIVIQAINEATIGNTSFAEMLQSLEAVGRTVPGRYYLLTVADMLKKAETEIQNQFVSKFNQQQATFIVHRYDKSPKILRTFKTQEGQTVPIYGYDKDGNLILEYNSRIFNANRNELATNLRDKAQEDFYANYGLDSDQIPSDVAGALYSRYITFKNSVASKITSKGIILGNTEAERTENYNKLKADLKDLLELAAIELSDEAITNLIAGRLPGRGDVVFNFNTAERDNFSVFNPKSGILQTIFGNFASDRVASLNEVYGSSGAVKLFDLEAAYQQSYYNTSVLNGKGQKVWGYSAPNPLSTEFFKIHKELKNNTDSHISKILDDPFRSKSTLLNTFYALNTEERRQFLENFKYGIVNTLKAGSRDGKDLNNTERREFILTQLIALSSNAVKDGRGNNWSFKFLTTPSDKSVMYQVQTPDVKVEYNKGVPVVGDATVNRFYNYFEAEYDRIMAYQNASPEQKAVYDSIDTFEPRLFYFFPVLNLKNANPLWANGVLNKMTPAIRQFVRDQIKTQVETDITSTKDNWEKLGLWNNNKLIASFGNGYRKKAGPAVAMTEEIANVEKSTAGLQDKELQKQLLDEAYEAADRSMSRHMLYEYAINYHLHNMEMQIMFLGDPADFLKKKSAKLSVNEQIFNSSDIDTWKKYIDAIRDNLSKRMAGVQAAGMVGNVGENETANTVVLVDNAVSSKMFLEYRKVLGESGEKYGKIDHMDGQEIITAEEDLLIKLQYGKISQGRYDRILRKVRGAHKDLENPTLHTYSDGTTGYIREENLFTDEEGFIAQAQKPVVFAMVPLAIGPNLTKFKTTYYKPSAFGLYPQFTQGLEIDHMREAAYELGKKGTKVDRFVMLSAAKLGAKASVNKVFSQNPDGRVNIDKNALMGITVDNIDSIPRDNLRIQMEVPYDPDKDKIRIASQQVKLIFNEILDIDFNGVSVAKYLPEFHGKSVTGAELKELHDETYKKLLQLSKEEVLKDIGATVVEHPAGGESYIFENYEKLQRVLYKQAIEQGYDLPSLEGLELTEDKQSFKIPLSFSTNADRYEKLLLAMIKKVILQKIHGRSFILATETGFVPKMGNEVLEGREGLKEAEERAAVRGEQIIFSDKFDRTKGLLPARPNPDNPKEILPAQVLISFKFKDAKGNSLNLKNFLKTDDAGRQILDTSKFDPEILRMLGIRIPVQGHPSMASIEIVGFIPEFMGDLIIAPMDFTKQFGSDFDIDKLYAYTYNYNVTKEGRIVRYKDKDKRYTEKDLDEEESLADKMLADSEEPVTPGKKALQNKLMDIYHSIMVNDKVWAKSMEGITEGNLTTLSDEIREHRLKDQSNDYFSPSSEQNKVDEYFENKAGKLGVGIYSANNTFATVIEGKGIKLAQFVFNEKGQRLKKESPLIILDSTGAEHKFVELSGAKGFNRIISAYQSGAVDNAKLKILDFINSNQHTMGVSALMAMLADDSIKDNGTPLLTEDFIVYFLGQPAIVDYINSLSLGNDSLSGFEQNFKENQMTKALNALLERGKELMGSEFLEAIAEPGKFSTDVLRKNIFEPTENAEYLIQQFQALEKFNELSKASDDLRTLQYLLNADSRGTAGSLDESLYKRTRLGQILFVNRQGEVVGLPNLLHADRAFIGKTGTTLQGEQAMMGITLPIKLFGETGIFSSGSVATEEMIRAIYRTNGRNPENYSYKFGRAVNKALLSYLQSDSRFEIQREGFSVTDEKIDLLYGSSNSTSLASDIEAFKKTEEYKNSTILKPLFESLKIRTETTKRHGVSVEVQDGARFVEFQAFTGLINPVEEIVQSLEYLRQNHYPLFEKLVKYTLLVQFSNSPVSLKNFIAPYYLQGVGIAERYRIMAAGLNTSVLADIQSKEAFPEIPFFVEQFLQHNPDEAVPVNVADINFLKPDGSASTEPTTVFTLDTGVHGQYATYAQEVGAELQALAAPYLALYDQKAGKQRLFKVSTYVIPGKEELTVYYEIPTLGQYNLEEYNYAAEETQQSVLFNNNPIVPEQYIIQKEQPVKDVEADETIAPIYPNQTGKLGEMLRDYFNVDMASDSTGQEKIKAILNTIVSDRNLDNPYFKEVAKLLLETDAKTNFTSGMNFMVSDHEDAMDIYDPKTNTVQIASSTTAEQLPYKVIHELLHAATVSNLSKGEAGVQLRGRIDRLITHLESDENLQAAIDYYSDTDRNIQALRDKLARLRTGESDLYADEIERKILNPLVNSYEFVAMVLGDREVQDFLNKVSYQDYPGDKTQTMWERIKEVFYLFAVKLSRMFNLDIKDNSALKAGIGMALESLEKTGENGESSPGILKLVGISGTKNVKDTPQDTVQPEKLSKDYFQTLKEAYHAERQTIHKAFKAGTITEEVKITRLAKVAEKIRRVTEIQDKLIAGGFNLIDFYNNATRDIVAARKLLNSKDELSIEEYNQIATAIKFYNILYTRLKFEYDSNTVWVTQELMDKVTMFQQRANLMASQLLNSALQAYVSEYNTKTGHKKEVNDFINTKATSALRNRFINLLQSKNSLARSIGRVVSEMVSETESSIKEHQIEDAANEDKFLAYHSFDDITEVEEYEDEFGIKKTEKNFINRYTGAYHRRVSQIFSIAGRMADKKRKQEFVSAAFAELGHTIDLRYLAPEMYNEEMKFYYGTENDRLKLVAGDLYANHLEALYKEQFDDFGDEYAERRVAKILESAKARIEDYRQLKELEEERINALDIPASEKKVLMLDWISYNSPFVVLNERLPLEQEKGSILRHEKSGPAREARGVVKTNQAGETYVAKNLINFAIRKERTEHYIVKKANRKVNGKLTGYYNDRFLTMENAHFNRLASLAALREEGKTGEAEALEQVPTLYEFWDWAIKRQNYYLSAMPRYLTEEVRFSSMVDVEDTVRGRLDKKLTQIKKIFTPSWSFYDNLLNNYKNFWLLPELANLAYDGLVQAVSEKARKADSARIDFIRNAAKQNFNPSGLKNTLDKQGMGQLKTSSLKIYMETLRNMAITYKIRNEAESMIRLGEFLFDEAKQMDETTTGLSLVKTEQDLIKWTVDNKLYGADRVREYASFANAQSKMFWVAPPHWKLTAQERKKYLTIQERIYYLQDKSKEATTPSDKNQIAFEIEALKESLAKINRVVNVKTLGESFMGYLRAGAIHFAVFGRITDFFASGVYGGLREAVDGRLYSFEDYSKAFLQVMKFYMPKAAGSLTAVGSAFMLNPAGVAAGLALRTGAGMINTQLDSQHKLTELMKRLGALDFYHTTTDDEVITTSVKHNASEEITDMFKLLKPAQLVQEVEQVNKSIPTLAILYATELKDKEGNTRSLYDAFKVDDSGKLVWNEEEFGSQDEAGYNFVTGDKMLHVKAKIRTAVNNVNGDYGNESTLLLDSSVRYRLLMLLRRYMAQWVQARFGDVYEDENTGQQYLGSYNSIMHQIIKRYKEGKFDDRDFVLAANRQALLGVVFNVALFAGMILTYIAAGGGDPDKEEDKNSSSVSKMMTMLFYFTNGLFLRLFQDNTVFVDPAVIRKRSITGLHPAISMLYNATSMPKNIYRWAQGDDLMSHQELTANGLSTLVKLPHFNKKGETVYRASPTLSEYPDVSRLMYNFQKLVPWWSQARSLPKKFNPVEQGNYAKDLVDAFSDDSVDSVEKE